MDATAATEGTVGNGYRPGEIATLVDPVAGVAGVQNIQPSFGGAEAEPDERYRSRIRESPERLSVAGPYGAYRFHARSVNQRIIDAAVTNPEPGTVRVSVLTKTGLPTDGLLDRVRERLSAEDVRPLTDTVEVIAPSRVAYRLEAGITLKRGTDAEATRKAAQDAADAYAGDRRAGLGRDLVPSQIVDALHVPGVYAVEVTSPTWRVLDAHEWADAEAVAVTIEGTHDG